MFGGNVDNYIQSAKNAKNKKELQRVIEYDFKDEAPFRYQKKDPIKKAEEYKKTGTNFDCDRCDLANAIYKRLFGWDYWDWRNNKGAIPTALQEMADRWGGLSSDTMNSFQTTYNRSLVLYSHDHNVVDYQKSVNNFARLYHTIGNFTLVPARLNLSDPASFNSLRGYPKPTGIHYVCDYWDLSLKLIQENLDPAAFKQYIDTFFLNDYVDANYNIKPLIKRHRHLLSKGKLLPISNPDIFLPVDKHELKEYLKNVNALIKKRGEKMLEELLKSI